MDKQSNLMDIEIEQAVKPVIKRVKNTYMTASGYLVEEVISKKWLLKHLNQKLIDA
jgi:hypothetical protein